MHRSGGPESVSEDSRSTGSASAADGTADAHAEWTTTATTSDVASFSEAPGIVPATAGSACGSPAATRFGMGRADSWLGADQRLAMDRMCSQVRKRIVLTALLLAVGTVLAAAQDADYQVDPAQSSVKFTLGDVLHTVRGTFQLKQGGLQVEPGGKVSGQVGVAPRAGEA